MTDTGNIAYNGVNLKKFNGVKTRILEKGLVNKW